MSRSNRDASGGIRKELSVYKNENALQLLLKASIDTVWPIANMGQDVREAMTGGSVAVVGVNAVLAENVVNKQIYGRKTDFMVVDDTCNLIDRTKLIPNMKVSGGVTGLLTAQAGYYASDFLEIQPNTVYYYGNIYTGYFAYFDINGVYISGMNASTAEVKLFSPFTTPVNAYFMRITLNSSAQVPICWISKTNVIPADFRYKQANVNFNDEQKDAVKSLANNAIGENPITVEQTNFIIKAGNANPIDRSKIESGYYIKGQSAGEKTATASGLWVTDFCKLLPETQYYYDGLYSGYYAFYDIDKNYISGFGAYVDVNSFPNPFTTPANCAYGRFTLNDVTRLDNCWINVENEMPMDRQHYALTDTILIENARNTLATNPCDYMGDEISVFNKGLCIGDSLTYGVFNLTDGSSTGIAKYGYPTILTKLTGVTTTNAGLASYDTKQWYEYNDTNDFSGHDFAIIQLGVNDVAHTAVNVAGGIVDFTTESAVYLANIVDYIKSQNQKIKAFISTILPAYQSVNYDAMSDVIRNFVAGRTDCY